MSYPTLIQALEGRVRQTAPFSGFSDPVTRREAERMLWLFKHPFGADIIHAKETNS